MTLVLALVTILLIFGCIVADIIKISRLKNRLRDLVSSDQGSYHLLISPDIEPSPVKNFDLGYALLFVSALFGFVIMVQEKIEALLNSGAIYAGEINRALYYSLTPASSLEGLGGASFLSVVTGLNYFLIRGDIFRASINEIESNWNDRLTKHIVLITSIYSEKEKEFAQRKIQIFTERRLSLIAEHSLKQFKFISYFAGLCFWIGCMLLFLQISGGILSLLLLLPMAMIGYTRLKFGRLLNQEIRNSISFALVIMDHFKRMDLTNELEKKLFLQEPPSNAETFHINKSRKL